MSCTIPVHSGVPPRRSQITIPDPFYRPRTTPRGRRELLWGRWNGWEFGQGTPWEIVQTDLANMPGIRTGDTSRNQQDGDWPGQDWEEARALTVNMRALGCERSPFLVDELVAATGVRRQERWLDINDERYLMCRPRRRDVPQLGEGFGPFLTAAVQWVATDPRLYGPEQMGTAWLMSAEEEGRIYAPADANYTDGSLAPNGDVWARQYPEITYQDPLGAETITMHAWRYAGAERHGGLIVAQSPGLRPSWRISARIFGPVLNPTLMHIQRQEFLTVNVDLRAGQVLDLDWWNGRIQLEDRSRYLLLTRTSRWWPIDPGLNTIRFLSPRYDPEARVELRWRWAS